MITMILSASVPVKVCMLLLLWMSVRSWATGIYLYKTLASSLSTLNVSVQKKPSLNQQRAVVTWLHSYAKNLNELGMIAKISPYVGLIGTVFGVMHTMAKLASDVAINMSIVGPGISEALITTALGLCVAIPASVMHDVCQQYMFQLEDLLMPLKEVK